MTTEQFISEIAKYVQKYAPKYNIKVYSPAIAQAILESGRGTSELAVNANNYHGLKYRPNRCPTACGIYYKVGSEQNPDGSYTSSAMQWMRFPDMENGVIGYFDFINTSNYSNLKGVTDPETYLKNIKADGYATSLNYVDNVMAVIKSYNLTQYDPNNVSGNVSVGGQMGYTNSPLVDYVKISPNKTVNRTHSIDTVTIHCVVGQVTVERLGEVFAPTSRQASSNYGIGLDGRIGMYVEEKDRSWCSGGKDKNGNVIRVNGISGADNDHRAITIEVASDTTHPYAVTDKAYAALIELLADICKRNGIKQLLWKADKSLVGQVDKQNMTVHRWFATKACPGDYLYNRHGQIADEVNKKLGVISSQSSSSTATPSTSTSNTYTVVKNDTLSSIGAKLGIAWKTIADLNGIKSPYVIYVGQVLKLPGESVLDNNFVIGDKVKVTGTIYGNGNGTGGSIKKNGSTMYVVDIVDSKTYKHYIGLSVTKSGARQGWAEHSILTKLN